MVAYFLIKGPICLEFELIQAFIHVVTWNYLSIERSSGAADTVVWSGRNLSLSKI